MVPAGEIFGGLDVPPGTNDGARLLRELAAAGDAGEPKAQASIARRHAP